MKDTRPEFTFCWFTDSRGIRCVQLHYQGQPLMAQRPADEAGERAAQEVFDNAKRGVRSYRVTGWDGDKQAECEIPVYA